MEGHLSHQTTGDAQGFQIVLILQTLLNSIPMPGAPCQVPMPGVLCQVPHARCPMPGAPCQVPHARCPSVQLAVLEPCLPGVDTCCLLRPAALWDHEEQCPRVGCSQTPGAYDRLRAQRLGTSILFAFSEQSLRKLSCFPNSTKYICHIMSGGEL